MITDPFILPRSSISEIMNVFTFMSNRALQDFEVQENGHQALTPMFIGSNAYKDASKYFRLLREKLEGDYNQKNFDYFHDLQCESFSSFKDVFYDENTYDPDSNWKLFIGNCIHGDIEFN